MALEHPRASARNLLDLFRCTRHQRPRHQQGTGLSDTLAYDSSRSEPIGIARFQRPWHTEILEGVEGPLCIIRGRPQSRRVSTIEYILQSQTDDVVETRVDEVSTGQIYHWVFTKLRVAAIGAETGCKFGSVLDTEGFAIDTLCFLCATVVAIRVRAQFKRASGEHPTITG